MCSFSQSSLTLPSVVTVCWYNLSVNETDVVMATTTRTTSYNDNIIIMIIMVVVFDPMHVQSMVSDSPASSACSFACCALALSCGRLERKSKCWFFTNTTHPVDF